MVVQATAIQLPTRAKQEEASSRFPLAAGLAAGFGGRDRLGVTAVGAAADGLAATPVSGLSGRGGVRR